MTWLLSPNLTRVSLKKNHLLICLVTSALANWHFHNGKFRYKEKRDISLVKPISLVKYFNQKLVNHTQRLASDTGYIFFGRSIIEQENFL